MTHRNHLLANATTTAPMAECGAGHTVRVQETAGGRRVTTHFWVFRTGFPAGSAATMPQFLTGVAYADADQDGQYDAGEGLAGVTVLANELETTTNAAGGWSLAVANGSHDVTCSGGAFSGTATAAGVVVGDANRQVDCISGEEHAIVDFVPEPGASSALGAALALAALSRRAPRVRPVTAAAPSRA